MWSKKITTIPEEAFWGCEKLHNIKLKEGLTHIEERAFKECKCIEFIEIPNSVISIGTDAFASCKALKRVIVHNIDAEYRLKEAKLSQGVEIRYVAN